MSDASRSHSPREAFVPSPGLADWLAEQGLSFAVSIYDPGTLLLVGLADDGQVSVHQTPFPACIRLCADGDRLWIGALQQLWRFDNALRESDRHDGFDRVLVPRVGFATGYVNIHDIGIDERRRPVFVNTWHGCLARPSLEASFVPIWRPAAVPELAGGSTLHLNGLAMEGGSPRYVTASRWDGTSGDAARSGGAVVDVTTGAVTAGRLSMPHSPRLHGGRLWIIESGTGQLGWIDGKSGTLEAVAFCPGYLRGLALHGDFAVVTLSRVRTAANTFPGLPLPRILEAGGQSAQSGVCVIDVRTGETVHWLRTASAVGELFDLALLHGVRRPMALAFDSDLSRRFMIIGGQHSEAAVWVTGATSGPRARGD